MAADNILGTPGTLITTTQQGGANGLPVTTAGTFKELVKASESGAAVLILAV